MAVNNIVEISGKETLEEIIRKINLNFTQLASLNGGPQGPAGVQGVPGLPGLQGVQGERGVKGDPGTQIKVIEDIEDWPDADEMEEGYIYFGDDADGNVVARMLDENGKVQETIIVANEKIDVSGFLARLRYNEVQECRTVFLKENAESLNDAKVGIAYGGKESSNEYGAQFTITGGNGKASKLSKLYIGARYVEPIDMYIDNKKNNKDYSGSVFMAVESVAGASLGIFKEGTEISDIVGLIGSNEKKASFYTDGSIYGNGDVTVSMISGGNHFGTKSDKAIEKTLSFGEKRIGSTTLNGFSIANKEVTLSGEQSITAKYNDSFVLDQSALLEGGASLITKRNTEGPLIKYYRKDKGELPEFTFEELNKTLNGSRDDKILNFYGHVEDDKQQHLRFSELKEYSVFIGGWDTKLDAADYSDDNEWNQRKTPTESGKTFNNIYTNFDIKKDALTISCDSGKNLSTYEFKGDAFNVSNVNGMNMLTNEKIVATYPKYGTSHRAIYNEEDYGVIEDADFVLAKTYISCRNTSSFLIQSTGNQTQNSGFNGYVNLNGVNFTMSYEDNKPKVHEISSNSNYPFVFKAQKFVFSETCAKGAVNDYALMFDNDIPYKLYSKNSGEFVLSEEKSEIISTNKDLEMHSDSNISINSSDVLSLLGNSIIISGNMNTENVQVLCYLAMNNSTDIYEIYLAPNSGTGNGGNVMWKKVSGKIEDNRLYKGNNSDRLLS